MKRLVTAVALLALLPLLLTACGDDDDDDDGGGADQTEATDGGEGGVDVVLGEFTVTPEPASTPAGSVTFQVENAGAEVHEFVVAAAASAEELPVDADGAVDEEAFGEENILGEIEDMDSQTSDELQVDMDAGGYVLFCNVVEEEETGEVESHYAEGMFTTFTVE